MRRLLLLTCFALACFLCLAASAQAHKVNIFAYVDGNSVVTESGYSRSKRVHQGSVEVYDKASGKMLLSGTTDDNGTFAFDIPAEARKGRMDLLLRLKAGEGHQAEWIVKYSEFGDGQAAAEPAEEVAAPAAGTVPTAETSSTSSSMVGVRTVQTIVHRELAPVKQMLAELNQNDPGITEILGGIGYIFGLFGVAAYMKSRSSR